MSGTKRPHSPSRRGLTLVELVVSMVVMTVIMAGIGSAIFISRHALPDPDRDTMKILVTSQAIHQMMEEIRMAIYVSEYTETAITFSVADRDDDGHAERIRYAWAGSAGDSLTREYNGGSPVTILDAVQDLSFTYETESVTETYSGAPVWGSEQLLSSYTGAVTETDYQYDVDHWIGQVFTPAPSLFSPQSMYWRVTRVRFVAMSHSGTDGTIKAQIRSVGTNDLPASTVLGEATYYESSVSSSYTWTEVGYADSARSSPGENAALVLKYVSGSGTVSYFRYDTDGGTGMLETSNAGSSWNLRTDESMQYEIYGRIAEQGPDQTLTRHYLSRVGLEIQTQETTLTPMSPATVMLNRPEVLTSFWESEFDQDPTSEDRNLDESDDWVTHDGSSFNQASLSDGKYCGSQVLLTHPDNNLVEPVTIEATMRSIATSYPIPGLLIYADWANGEAVFFQFYVAKQSDGTQNLIFGDTVGSALRSLITVEGLPADPFDLRLIIDPVVDTVAMFLNGSHVATEFYAREAPASPEHHIRLQPGNSAGEFDSISIRVGGNGE